MKLKNSIMGKMILLLVVAAIPLYAVGLGIYNLCAQQLVNEILGTKYSQMAYYMQSMEGELERLVMLEAMIVNDGDIGSLSNRYSYFGNYEWGRRVNALRDRLVNTRLSCAYAETTTAFMGPLNMKLNDLSGLGDMDEESQHLVTRIADNMPRTICMEDGKLYAVVSVVDSNRQPVYTLATKLSLSRLRMDLEQLESSVPSQSAVIFDEAHLLAATSPGMSEMWSAACEQRKALETGETLKLRLNGEDYYVLGVYSPFTRMLLMNFTRKQDIISVSWRYTPYLLALTAAAVVLMFVLAHGTRTLVHRPLRKLVAAFQEIEGGNLTVSIQHHRQDEFKDVYQSFNQMTGMLDQYVNRSLKQELLLKRSELLQLQAQINPHFLYNSYFLLHRLVKRRDWQNAERLSGYMGECFRYITRNSQQRVPLHMEAEHARIYAEIQEMRFGGRIRVEFGEITEALRELNAPRLILQPVLENAFEHGLRDTEEGGLVRVQFLEENGGCTIVVEDNGDTLSDERLCQLCQSLDDTEGETTALRNICHRLRLQEGDGLGFALSRSPLGGLRVRMTLGEGEKHESADR